VDKMEGVGWEFGGVVRSYPRGSRVILCLAVGDVKGVPEKNEPCHPSGCC
jgi:hypothetical protein